MEANHTARQHDWGCGFPVETIGSVHLVHTDSFEWLSRLPEDSIHSIVTDPPYGVKEYDDDQLEKRENGNGGIWRIPPSFDGHTRSPLPRFTALSDRGRSRLRHYFRDWSVLVGGVLRPGGHLFIASNSYLSQEVFAALSEGGLEYRGTIVRLVRTLRGGDRPKNAEVDYPDVSSMPRGGFEPWGLFRKRLLPGMRVSDCLREYATGGLRRKPDGNPFDDVIVSERTPRREKEIAGHPSLKPQSFVRQLVYAALPLGRGVVLDPFMGSGSTLAACIAVGYAGIGVERSEDYSCAALRSVPALAGLKVSFGETLQYSLTLS